jgi:hypothetical protein
MSRGAILRAAAQSSGGGAGVQASIERRMGGHRGALYLLSTAAGGATMGLTFYKSHVVSHAVI